MKLIKKHFKTKVVFHGLDPMLNKEQIAGEEQLMQKLTNFFVKNNNFSVF